MLFCAPIYRNPTFRELLQRVQRSALGAYEHQDIPFEKLAAELRPVRAMSQSPLFQVVFHLRNVPERVPEFSGLQVEVLRSDSAAAQFDLTFAVREIAAGLEVEAEYNTDLFDAHHRNGCYHYETLAAGSWPTRTRSPTVDTHRAEDTNLCLLERTEIDYPKDVVTSF